MQRNKLMKTKEILGGKIGAELDGTLGEAFVGTVAGIHYGIERGASGIYEGVKKAYNQSYAPGEFNSILISNVAN